MSDFLMNTYLRPPMVLVRGSGVRVWDADGREYLDFVAGISVNNLGHCHPRVVEAIRAQTGEIIHSSNLYHTRPQAELARRLAEASIGGRVFFCNSGAEAVEAAIKLARRRWWRRRGAGAGPGGDAAARPEADIPRVVAFHGAFHGRTLAALAATGRYLDGFAPLPPGFFHVPFNDLDAAAAVMDETVSAVLVEPVQGEGGVVPADPAFLAGLRELCDRTGALLIFDEIQTGLGRTGRMFAYQHHGVEPDVLTLAKALGGGLPLGAVVARGEAAETFRPGDHGSTFGGNPVACAAALAALDVLAEEDLPARAAAMGEYLADRLRELAGRHPVVRQVRGLGLMVGLELAVSGRPLVERCREAGLLANCTAERVLRFLPPLVVTRGEIDRAVAVLDGVLAGAGAPASGGSPATAATA